MANYMDFLEYSRWANQVKEEPMAITPPQLDQEVQESNFEEFDQGWMCKFPCDAQATLNAAFTDSLPNDLLESFEISASRHLSDDLESLNLQTLDIPINSAVTEGSSNETFVNESVHTAQTDGSANNRSVLHQHLEENGIVCCSQESTNVDASHKQQLNAGLKASVLTDTPGEILMRKNINQIPAIEFLPNEGRQEEVVYTNNKARDELLECLSVQLQKDTIENVAALANTQSRGELDACLCVTAQNCISEEKCLASEGIVIEAVKEKHAEIVKSRKSGQNFECPNCGKILKRKSGFISHMKSHLTFQSSYNVLCECELCKKLFHDRRSLSLHRKVCKHMGRDVHSASHNKQDVQCFGESNIKKDCNSNHNKEILQDVPEQQQPECNQQNCHEIFDELSSSKNRQQSFTEECPENSVTENPSGNRNNISTNCSVENQNPPDNDELDNHESWFSELRCKERQDGNSSNSSTLSLRLFRLRKPKVPAKHIEENKSTVDESNLFKTDILGQSQEEKLVQPSQINCHSVACHESVSTEKDDVQTRATEIVREHSEGFSEESSTVAKTELQNARKPFILSAKLNSPTTNTSEIDHSSESYCTNTSNQEISESCRQAKARSDLRIRIKPIVVLNRVKMSEDSNNDINISKENTENCCATIYAHNNHPAQVENLQSRVPETCDFLNCEDDPEDLICNFKIIKQTSENVFSQSQDINSNSTSECSEIEDEAEDTKMPEIIMEKSVRHEFNLSHKDESGFKYHNKTNTLATLEKKYGLKRCYVKLSRLSDKEISYFMKNKQQSKDIEVVRELKTCGILKLRRTNSESWTISSSSFVDVENMDTDENVKEYEKPQAEANRKLACILNNSTQNIARHTPQKQLSDDNLKKLIKDHKRKQKHTPKASPLYVRRPSIETYQRIDKCNLKIPSFKSFKSKCTWCHKTFFKQESLAMHLRTHTLGYKCHNCSATFHFWMELQTHMAGCSLVSLLNCQNTLPIKKMNEVII